MKPGQTFFYPGKNSPADYNARFFSLLTREQQRRIRVAIRIGALTARQALREADQIVWKTRKGIA